MKSTRESRLTDTLAHASVNLLKENKMLIEALKDCLLALTDETGDVAKREYEAAFKARQLLARLSVNTEAADWKAWKRGMLEASEIVLNGCFLHDDAPDARVAKAASEAIKRSIAQSHPLH